METRNDSSLHWCLWLWFALAVRAEVCEACGPTRALSRNWLRTFKVTKAGKRRSKGRRDPGPVVEMFHEPGECSEASGCSQPERAAALANFLAARCRGETSPSRRSIFPNRDRQSRFTRSRPSSVVTQSRFVRRPFHHHRILAALLTLRGELDFWAAFATP